MQHGRVAITFTVAMLIGVAFDFLAMMHETSFIKSTIRINFTIDTSARSFNANLPPGGAIRIGFAMPAHSARFIAACVRAIGLCLTTDAIAAFIANRQGHRAIGCKRASKAAFTGQWVACLREPATRGAIGITGARALW